MSALFFFRTRMGNTADDTPLSTKFFLFSSQPHLFKLILALPPSYHLFSLSASSNPMHLTIGIIVTPISAVIALGLTVSIGIAVVARRMRLHVADHEIWLHLLHLSGALKTSGDDLKTFDALCAARITAGDAHEALEVQVEADALRFDHFFAARLDYEDDEDDEEEGLEYPAMSVLRNVKTSTPNIKVEAAHEPSTAEIEVDTLLFRYLFADADDNADSHLEDYAGVPGGYSVVSSFGKILEYVSVHFIPTKLVPVVSPVVVSPCVRHPDLKAGKGYAVKTRSPSILKTAALGNLPRNSSLRTVVTKGNRNLEDTSKVNGKGKHNVKKKIIRKENNTSMTSASQKR
ncbi:hypothetical protein B0H19DRAFT_1057669 [Mycena capillaripes]|nr:hypothetical protein B0H19DRAFT_1057669 [Mycena capillaripes]